MKYAVVFPGQGSQSEGMLAELSVEYPLVKDTFNQGSEAIGFDLWEIVASNPDNKLNRTEYTQCAMLAAGTAVWRIWRELGLPHPTYLAGHSLGEYTALLAANAIAYPDAIRLVLLRGQLMQEAVPEGEGAMAAIIGLDDEVVKSICVDASQDDVVEAVNFNSPTQIVIAGNASAVNRAIDSAKEKGAKRALLLPVSVPSHSSLMQPASEKLRHALNEINIEPPLIPVIHNVDGAMHDRREAIIDVLVKQLFSPVFWSNNVKILQQNGVDTLLELGPGKVLAGLGKRISRDLQCIAVEKPQDLEKAKAILVESE